MKNKHRANRKDYPDSRIHDALDGNNFCLSSTAVSLGVSVATLRNWVIRSPNLNGYVQHKQAEQALKAREKLEQIMENMDPADPRSAAVLMQTCKIMLDRFEPTLSKQEVNSKIEISESDKSLVEDFLNDTT